MDSFQIQKHIKPMQFLLLAMLFNAMGCVSIREPVHSLPVQNCNRLTPVQVAESCDLYDRREVLSRWASHMRPAVVVPQRAISWGSLQRQHCVDGCEALKEWMRKKKADANPPPWPRFHPLPTRPAFEPTEFEETMVPQEYGRFCKEN